MLAIKMFARMLSLKILTKLVEKNNHLLNSLEASSIILEKRSSVCYIQIQKNN